MYLFNMHACIASLYTHTYYILTYSMKKNKKDTMAYIILKKNWISAQLKCV